MWSLARLLSAWLQSNQPNLHLGCRNFFVHLGTRFCSSGGTVYYGVLLTDIERVPTLAGVCIAVGAFVLPCTRPILHLYAPILSSFPTSPALHESEIRVLASSLQILLLRSEQRTQRCRSIQRCAQSGHGLGSFCIAHGRAIIAFKPPKEGEPEHSCLTRPFGRRQPRSNGFTTWSHRFRKSQHAQEARRWLPHREGSAAGHLVSS